MHKRARIGVPLTIVLALTLLLSGAAPAAADSWAPGPIYTTYTIFYPYMNPTNLNFYSPATVEIDKTSQLRSGYSGANICRDLFNRPLYRLTTSSGWDIIGYNFGSGWWVTFNNTWSGDNTYHMSSPSQDVAEDSNADGYVMQDYGLQWSSYIGGRQITVSYVTAIQYGASCTTDSYSTSQVLRS